MNRLIEQFKKLLPEKWQWVFDHQGFRRYFSNTGWMFFGQMVNLTLSFVVGAWVARHLGPENYGVLNYALSVAGIFGFLSALGVDGVLARDLVRYPEKRRELLGTALVIKGIGATLSIGASLGLIFVIETTPLVKILVMLFSLSYILQPFNVISSLFQAKVEARHNIKAQIAGNLISAILKIVWIFSGLGVIYLMGIYVIDAFFNTLFLWLIYWHNRESVRGWHFDRQLFGPLLKSGWPLLLSGAAAFLLFKIDQVMIGNMLGNAAVGLYSAAAKLSEVWYFIPGILAASLFPAIINAKRSDPELYQRRLRNFYTLMAISALGVIVPVILLSKPLIVYLFGQEYLASLPVLRIHIFSALGIFLGYAANQYLMAENREKDVFRANFLGMVLNVGLNLWLIPALGIAGAAIATLVAYAVTPIYVLILDIWQKRRREIDGKLD